jgi:hypothetical protein
MGVDRILASTKSKHQQNVGACADYVQVCRSISLLFWPGGVLSSWLVPDLADVLLFEDLVISSCSYKWLVAANWPAYMGRLSPVLYRPIRTSLLCRNVTKYRHQQNIGYSLFFAKIQQSVFLLTGVYQKVVKAKNYHHHCSMSVFLFLTSIWRPSQRSSVLAENCPNWGGGGGGESGLSPVPLPPALITRAAGKVSVPWEGGLAHTW